LYIIFGNLLTIYVNREGAGGELLRVGRGGKGEGRGERGERRDER